MSGYIGVEPVAQATKVRTFGTLTFASDTIPVAGGFSPGNIEVYINGAAVQPTDYDDSDGLGVVFIQQLSAGTEYVIMEARPFLVADTWSKAEAYSKAQSDDKFSEKGYFHARDEKPSGTSGGTSVSGTQTRTLNTVLSNSIAGASLSGNQITLPAGVYRINAQAPSSYAGRTKAFIYNASSSVVLLSGRNGYSGPGNSVDQTVVGKVTLAATTEIELRHYTSTSATGGLGASASQPAIGPEVYTEIEIFKVA